MAGFSARAESSHWLTFCLIVTTCVTMCGCADPTLSENTVTDSAGNTADANSVITWVPIPSGKSYNASSSSYDAKGMETLYDMAKNFVGLCLFPSGYPSALITELAAGFDFSAITDNISQYVTPIIGYGICIVVGILFILIFPLVGCCFCCCRCCGNCGGKRVQDEDDAANDCKRNTYSIILFILISFTVSGSICNYVSNESISEALTNFGTTAKTNVKDLKTFLDNLQLQMEYITTTNFNFTTDVLFRDLGSMGFLVGIPVRDKMKVDGGVDAAFDTVLSLQGHIDNLSVSLNKVDSSLTNLKTSVTELNTDLTNLKNKITTDFATCGCGPGPDTNAYQSDIDPNQVRLRSGYSSKNSISHTLPGTLLVTNHVTNYIVLPFVIDLETSFSCVYVKNQVTSFSDQIEPMMDQVNSLSGGDVNTQMESLVDDLNGYIDIGSTYDKYRWYGGVGLASIILLICLLQLLGLVFGVFGHERTAKPTERNFVSNCGGNCLMASVVLIFIFSWLLTLLTLVLFALGAPLERLLCDPISDPDFVVFESTFNSLLDDQMGGGESFLGKTLFQNGSVDLKLTDILKNCKANQGAYKALKLNKLINIDEIADVRKLVDIDSNLDLSSIDMSTTTVITPDLSDQLTKLKESSNIDYSTFRTELAKSPSTADLTTQAADVRTIGNGVSGQNQANMYAISDEMLRIRDENMVYVNGNKTQLSSDIDDLEIVTNGIPTAVDAVNTSLYDLQDFLQNNGSTLIEAEAKNFANRLFGILDSYIADIKSGLEDDIGQCEPIWNLYSSMFVDALCRYTVDSLSGFWFSLGWCVFFFVPSTIFSVKLAKHFRTMEQSTYLDNVDPGVKNPNHPFSEPAHPMNIAPSPVFRSNKVGHADGCLHLNIKKMYCNPDASMICMYLQLCYHYRSHVYKDA
ncbi:hypothetical protein ScPMuIL_000365 [Solemya velum]